ncbi:NAD(P)-dependent oxidoreductase [Frigidibacter sp. SD6-1]|uniref:NAD(P)-dependent oxidoreductase n=1 Tax=Frigidibacter sp. SD6-1 TaxID=3032581 RepID=UPI0024DF9B50|nr:NAD(P)-dependent oxidoreductase [Frigidibacter sp. SD6-1]
MEIAVCLPLKEAQQVRLRRGVGDATLRLRDPADPCDAPIVFGNPEPEVIAANASLRWMQLESVGFGEYAGLDWSRPGGNAQVTNLAGFFADPVAETALAGILALMRGIDRLGTLRWAGDWVGDPVRAELRLLTGARVVLFGRGAINGRLAELLTPFRCKITSFGRDWTEQALDAALADADIVVATVPHTPQTAGLLDAPRIARMASGAVFCNLGRGSLVDEAALAEALTEGRLVGAVIDVTRDEPLPKGHAFWSTPNTILTQHSGGGFAEETDRKIDWFLDNLTRFRAGEPLRGLIDFARGY